MNAFQNRVVAFLDEKLGRGVGRVFADYDSRQHVYDYACALLAEANTLTGGCGIAPYLDYVTTWLNAFEKGARDGEPDEPFGLSIQLDPTAQGYALYRTEVAFLAKYPKPQEGQYRPQPLLEPYRYPVFAREEALMNNPNGSDWVVLGYLYYDQVTVVA
jgi:hypothetical protein